MKNRKLKSIGIILCLMFVLLILSGCSTSLTEDDIYDAKKEAYNTGYAEGYEKGCEEGFEEGFEEGYSYGSEIQREADCEDFLVDGQSITNIVELVYDKYGISPSEAFGIIDNYEYDASHGGYSWSEYQNAIEAMYYTVSLFPQDY